MSGGTPADRRESLRKLLAGTVRRGTFTLASGKTSDFYFDGRLITLAANGMVQVARVINDVLAARADSATITAVGGPTMGADPIAASVCVIAQTEYGRAWDSFIVRKEAKGHGAGKLIEGPPLTAASHVVLVEDVVTSGGSVLKAVDAVRATGAAVVCVIPLLDREEGAAEAFRAAGVELVPLFRRSELPPA
ncbi:MAG: orotate phosphoribosyltransferase [Hyphomicrobiaceae bacterium]